MSNNTAPDSWESQADSASANNSPTQPTDVTAKFSTLNVNAVEFVPSFCKTIGVEQNIPSEEETSENSPEHTPIINGMFFFISNFLLLFRLGPSPFLLISSKKSLHFNKIYVGSLIFNLFITVCISFRFNFFFIYSRTFLLICYAKLNILILVLNYLSR